AVIHEAAVSFTVEFVLVVIDIIEVVVVVRAHSLPSLTSGFLLDSHSGAGRRSTLPSMRLRRPDAFVPGIGRPFRVLMPRWRAFWRFALAMRAASSRVLDA